METEARRACLVETLTLPEAKGGLALSQEERGLWDYLSSSVAETRFLGGKCSFAKQAYLRRLEPGQLQGLASSPLDTRIQAFKGKRLLLSAEPPTLLAPSINTCRMGAAKGNKRDTLGT